MRSVQACLLSAVVVFAGATAPANAQHDARGTEMALALDFLALELAGWRLPDPALECIESLKLNLLQAGTFGASEMSVDPVLLDGPGPHARILAIEPDPADRRRRIVRFEWLVASQGGVRARADRFVMVLSDQQEDAAMMREPDQLMVRRECFGG